MHLVHCNVIRLIYVYMYSTCIQVCVCGEREREGRGREGAGEETSTRVHHIQCFVSVIPGTSQKIFLCYSSPSLPLTVLGVWQCPSHWSRAPFWLRLSGRSLFTVPSVTRSIAMYFQLYPQHQSMQANSTCTRIHVHVYFYAKEDVLSVQEVT